jgi:hypothetical protein
MHQAGLEGFRKRLAVHPTHHQDSAWRSRFANDCGDQSIGGVLKIQIHRVNRSTNSRSNLLQAGGGRNVSAYRRIGASAYRRIGVSACRRVGVSACRRVGVSAYRRIGVPTTSRAHEAHLCAHRNATHADRDGSLTFLETRLDGLAVFCVSSRSSK